MGEALKLAHYVLWEAHFSLLEVVTLQFIVELVVRKKQQVKFLRRGVLAKVESSQKYLVN